MNTKVHMQFYFPDGTYCMFTFCDWPTDKVEVTTKWKNCTCKNCLKRKAEAGKPA